MYLSKGFQIKLTTTTQNAQRGRVSFKINFIQVNYELIRGAFLDDKCYKLFYKGTDTRD